MIGKKIIFKESLDSTNNYAANLLKSGELAHGTVIMSAEQTRGKGQRGATWTAEPYKNIIFTCFVEYANLSVDKQESITHFVSLAVVHFLKEQGIQAAIKWPNDILIGSSKIAGILIENQLERSGCRSSIIGIGINVNQEDFGDFNATSMKLHTGEEYSMETLSLNLIQCLQTHFDKLQQFAYGILKADYLEMLWLKDILSDFEDSKGVFQGVIRGTDPSGRLLMEKEGILVSYDLKEIKFIARNTSEVC